ncbi:MAG: hypothetical protein DRP06_02215 [Candidatus Aenigmatarchaeota archaeon]|nr:MAG: hypothetical protein DRP06_02215 [Candidatus Aenigmarchaeota archaeon]
MHRRKIQLIAGSTYSISLPKEWVKKNKLKEKDELLIYEKDNKTLLLSSHSIKRKKINEISLNIDEYLSNIDQIIFALYYLGIENINLFSKKELTKEVKTKIRKALAHMSGTEISYEDKKKISLKILLDESKVNICQIFYRINIILELSLSNILDELDLEEIRLNENEIDRLYHLGTKLISLSLTDSKILHSSKIKNISLIPSYFLISKKLENIGDDIYRLGEYLNNHEICFEHKKEILTFIKNKLDREVSYLRHKTAKIFEKTKDDDFKKINNLISQINNKTIQNYLEDITRYIEDIEGETVNISFYKQLLQSSSRV